MAPLDSEDPDEGHHWTTVTSTTSTKRTSKSRFQPRRKLRNVVGPIPVDAQASAPQITERQLRRAWLRIWEEVWPASETARALRRDVRLRGGGCAGHERRGNGNDERDVGGRRGVENAVLLGVGTLSGASWDRRRRAMLQLALFVEVVLAFAPSPTRRPEAASRDADTDIRPLLSIPTYVQEPALNALDEAFLTSLGLVIIHRSRSFPTSDEHPRPQAGQLTNNAAIRAKISDRSLVFNAFVERDCFLGSLMVGKRPAVLVSVDFSEQLGDALQFLTRRTGKSAGSRHRISMKQSQSPDTDTALLEIFEALSIQGSSESRDGMEGSVKVVDREVRIEDMPRFEALLAMARTQRALRGVPGTAIPVKVGTETEGALEFLKIWFPTSASKVRPEGKGEEGE